MLHRNLMTKILCIATYMSIAMLQCTKVTFGSISDLAF